MAALHVVLDTRDGDRPPRMHFDRAPAGVYHATLDVNELKFTGGYEIQALVQKLVDLLFVSMPKDGE